MSVARRSLVEPTEEAIGELALSRAFPAIFIHRFIELESTWKLAQSHLRESDVGDHLQMALSLQKATGSNDQTC